jgi:hypothetical protein
MRLLVLLASTVCVTAGAQQTTTPQAAAPQPPADSVCTYRSCALSIAPAWDGLAIRRGIRGPRVANLHFFWPRDITPELRGPDTLAIGADSVAVYARRAVALRQAAAGFTDIGALTVGVAIVRALVDGRASTRDQVVGAVGLGALAISVPIHFAADGELSRAVWWHNLRLSNSATQSAVSGR